MKRNLKNKLVLYGLSVIASINMSGCAKKVDCNINENHVHLYTSEDNYSTYCDGEKEYIRIDGIPFYRDNKYKLVSTIEESFYHFLQKNNLVSIDEHYDLILKDNPKIEDYTEYQYKYKTMYMMSTGKTTIPMTQTHYSWTTDSTDTRLTGKTRVITNGYVGYRVYYDEKGKFNVEKSGFYYTLDDLISAGYDYFVPGSVSKLIDSVEIVNTESMTLK